MEIKDFPLRKLVDESNELINRTHKLFDEMNRDSERLPNDAFSQNKPLSIVFAGQYSAGKSSIIKALTGIQEIEIGHRVTTQVVTRYPWHSMLIVDTPGIGTGLGACREHDATALDAILRADVLVYVVTSEGFDNLIAEEFKRLIIDRDKAGETILVVNKMMNCADGNTPEQRAIIEGDLAITTSPYSPRDLNVVYIDAKAHLRSVALEKKNPRLSSVLRKDGNLKALATKLDNISRSNDVSVRLTTPLYQITKEVDNVIDDLDSAGGEQERLIRQRLREERSSIANSRTSIHSRAQGEYVQAASEIRDEGRKLADVINECGSEQDAEDALDSASRRVEEIEAKCLGRIDELLQECADSLEVAREELCVSLKRDLDVEVEYVQETNGFKRAVIDQVVKDGALGRGGERLIAFSMGDAAESGLKMYRASEAHLFFREASQKLGIKLKPWGAVKMARGLNYVGKALGVAGVILPALLELKDEKDADTRDKVATENRNNIRSQFNDEARAFIRVCEEGVENFDNEIIQPRLEAINGDLAAYMSDEMRRSVHHSNLVDLRNDCMQLIRDVHKWQKSRA